MKTQEKVIIKILKATRTESWYKDRIGQEFKVLETNNENKWYIVHKGRICDSFVDFSDCEIISQENE